MTPEQTQETNISHWEDQSHPATSPLTLRTCRQVDGQELLSAQHGDGAGGEAPEDVHVGRHVEEREVAEGGEQHGRAQRLCRKTNRKSLNLDADRRRQTCSSSVTGRHSLDAGSAAKYLIMERCRAGTLQQRNTRALAAMIPGKKNRKGGVCQNRWVWMLKSWCCRHLKFRRHSDVTAVTERVGPCFSAGLRTCALTCDRPLTLAQALPPLVNLKHKQPIRDQTVSTIS